MKNVMIRKKGYILMEVMLATGIFAMAGVGLATALDHIAKNCSHANQLSTVRIELASRLAAARLNPLVSGRQTEEDTLGAVAYTEEIVPVDFKQTIDDQAGYRQISMSGYFRITLTAEWKEGEHVQNEKAEIYVYQP